MRNPSSSDIDQTHAAARVNSRSVHGTKMIATQRAGGSGDDRATPQPLSSHSTSTVVPFCTALSGTTTDLFPIVYSVAYGTVTA